MARELARQAAAGVTAGGNGIAYREARGAGDFDFWFNGFVAKATFSTCPGDVLIKYYYAKHIRGSSLPWETWIEKEYKHVEGTENTVTREVAVPGAGDPYEYTITKITSTPISSCGLAGTTGNGVYGLASLHAMLSLGRIDAARGAGILLLEKSTIDSSTYLPAALEYVGPTATEVLVIKDSEGSLRQIKTPDALVNIIRLESPAEGYAVQFYHADQIGAVDAQTGLYAYSGSPFVTHRFENPDAGQIALTARLRVTEARPERTRVFDYENDVEAGIWRLSEGGGLRVTEEVTALDSNNDTVKTRTLKTAGGEVASVVATTTHMFAWGEQTIKEVLDPAGAALATTWTYYDNATADGTNYRRVKQRLDATGYWERYTYDSSGAVTRKVSPFLNAAPTADDAQCRVTTTDESALADVDGDGIAEKLTTQIDYTLNQETGRSYKIEWSKPVTLGTESFARRSDIRCTAAGATWNTTGNLVTETLSYNSGVFNGRTRRVVNADGTASLSTYAIGTGGIQTAVQSAGAPNIALDAIVDGTRTTTLTNSQGHDTQATVEDIVSALTLEMWVVTEPDAFGRAKRIDYADGTYETRNYACCGLSNTRDRHGRITAYDYDVLGRATHVTQNGLTTRTDYDAAGHAKSVTRIGTEASEIVQETNRYDLAGRRYEHRDALNRLTTTAEAFNTITGERTVTTTQPDLGTIIEISARDGLRLSVGGTAAAPLAYDYGVESGQLYTKETRIGDAGATTEWTKTYTDFAGRTVQTLFADGATTWSFYNSLGQLVRRVDADNVTTLYAYNARGEQTVSALDANANNLIDYDGVDRIVRTTTVVATKTVASATYTVRRTTSEAWETDNQNAPATIAVSEQTLDGLRSWTDTRGLTTTTVATYDGSGNRTVVTASNTDGKVVTQTYARDLLQSQVVSHPTLGTLSSVAYDYDTHNRLWTVTDSRNGTTTYTYNNDDQPHTVLTPDPDATRTGPGYDAQFTTYGYDDAGRQNKVTLPDLGEVNTTYYPHGQVKRTWGTRTYPVEYTYDPQLRVKTLTTWKDFASDAGAAVTTWNYSPQRGWLDNKRYADNTGPAYTYTDAGRLHTRTWVRQVGGQPLVTTYGYNALGSMNSIDYSDDTPDVSMTQFDRLGRPKVVTDGAGTRTLTYTGFGQAEDETYTAGPLNGLALDRGYDAYGRLHTVAVPSVYAATYDYDDASRLDTVTQGSRTAKYAYVPASSLVESVTIKDGGAVRLTTTKSFDHLNRLSSITNTPAASAAYAVAYDYNAANQRSKATREDATRWDYGYDALGQVTSAGKKLANDTPVPGHAYGFTFDDIGNRKTAVFNGVTSVYTPDSLNQYEQRTAPGSIEVLGEAQADATITYSLNAGQPQPVARQGGLFYAQVPVDNSASAVTTQLKVTGVKNNAGPAGEDAVSEVTRTVFTPPTPEVYAYDADGNLTADALWSYAWDGENRLKSMETGASAVAAGRPRTKLEFAYDGQGRRFAKKAYTWDGTAWVLTSSRLFLYEGWNLIAEFSVQVSGLSLQASYTWGLGLSGSLQGAGGVGGLLLVNAGTATHAVGYDGNGNVIGLVDMADGTRSATYEYGPFGDTLVADGPAAALNPYRFSTKFTDETGLLYYGLRYYNPSTGRWLSRDPIEERGGFNLYGMVGNNPVNAWDILGLADEKCTPCICKKILESIRWVSQRSVDFQKRLSSLQDYRDRVSSSYAAAPNLLSDHLANIPGSLASTALGAIPGRPGTIISGGDFLVRGLPGSAHKLDSLNCAERIGGAAEIGLGLTTFGVGLSDLTFAGLGTTPIGAAAGVGVFAISTTTEVAPYFIENSLRASTLTAIDKEIAAALNNLRANQELELNVAKMWGLNGCDKL